MTTPRSLRPWIALLFAAFVPLSAAAGFDPAAMHEKYVVGATYQTMGVTGYGARDVDGLPGDEILMGYTSMWHLLRWDPRTQQFEQFGFYENGVAVMFGGGGIARVDFADLDGDGAVGIVVLADDGALGSFDTDGTLRAVWVPKVADVKGMVVADVDDAPGDEIVLQTCAELTVWSFGAAAPLQRIPVDACDRMLVAQLDRDPQPELVLRPGTILDTRTWTVQWRYPAGFGSPLAAGDLDGDGIQELVGCNGPRCTAFDVAGQTTRWELLFPSPQHGTGSLAVADANFDGQAEVFTGGSSFGPMRKFDGQTATEIAQVKVLDAANLLIVANLDGDCDLEMVWVEGNSDSGPDTMHLGDATAMQLLGSSPPEERGTSGVAFADFAGNGDRQVLWTSASGTLLRFAGFASNTRSVRANGVPADFYANDLPVTIAAQLDGDPQFEYVVPSRIPGIVGRRIDVRDGATHATQWSVEVSSFDTISALASADLTGDGVPEILVASSILETPRNHPQNIVAVDGATHRILWRTKDELSLLLSSSCEGCIVQVAAADMNGDGAKEVLALVPYDGLYEFSGATGELIWHRQSLNRAAGFTIADVDPSAGPEIVLPQAGLGKLVIFDATGTTLIREKDLNGNGSAWAARVADLDGDGEAEIVVVGDDGFLMVLSARTLDLLWSGGVLFPWLSLGNQMIIDDVDGDGTTEIVVPSAHSLHVFEYRPPFTDSVAPLFNGSAHASVIAGCCAMALDWPAATDAASMPVRYRVYRSTNPQFTLDASTRIAETAFDTYTDRALTQGQTYSYAVTAVDRNGNETATPLRASATAPEECPARRRAVRRH